MTERKPREVPFETWVDRQVRVAQERGAFDDLPGAGKPLRRERAMTGEEWAVAWARREGADLVAALPPALRLRKEREVLVQTLPDRRSEADVRAAAEDFNARLLRAYRRPPEGPPVTCAPLDVAGLVQRWRDGRPAPTAAATPGNGADRTDRTDPADHWRRARRRRPLLRRRPG